jgi:glycosyltransferase involved in cell wall biosynthesis
MRIVFACHPSAGRPWSPASAGDGSGGSGGSEEAVISMAAGLAGRGHDVSVHMRRGGDQRHGLVRYAGWDTLRGERIDVVLVWRRPSLADAVDERAAAVGRRYLWLHDATAREDLAAQLAQFEKVFMLSAFQRGRYPQVPDEKVLHTRNGIDPAAFARPHPWRDPHLVVYGSDYNRGLRALLTSWPQVRAAVPTARLDVFYGWQGLELRSGERADRLKAEFEPLFAQPGVTHLGRIGHEQVAAAYRQAGVWAYPCSFPETSCISAMKAQAAGAIPAVIPSGALRETVRFGFATKDAYTDPEPRTDGAELVAQWHQGLLDLLSDPERQRQIRREMVTAARNDFAWEGVVDQWEAEFSR